MDPILDIARAERCQSGSEEPKKYQQHSAMSGVVCGVRFVARSRECANVAWRFWQMCPAGALGNVYSALIKRQHTHTRTKRATASGAAATHNAQNVCACTMAAVFMCGLFGWF